MTFAYALAALVFSSAAMLGRAAPPQVTYEKTEIRTQNGSLKHVTAVRNSSLWTEVREASDRTLPEIPRAKAGSSNGDGGNDRVPSVTNNGLLNFGTINNYNINNGAINSATVNGQAPDTVTVNGSAAPIPMVKLQRARPDGADKAVKDSHKRKIPEKAHKDSKNAEPSAVKAAERAVSDGVRKVLDDGDTSSVGGDSHTPKIQDTASDVAWEIIKSALRGTGVVSVGGHESSVNGGDSHRPTTLETVHNDAKNARPSSMKSKGVSSVVSSGDSDVSDSGRKSSISGDSHKLQAPKNVHNNLSDAQLSAIKAAVEGSDASGNGDTFLVGDDSRRRILSSPRTLTHGNRKQEDFGGTGAVSSDGTSAVSGGGRKSSSVDGVSHKHKNLEAAHNGGKKTTTGARNTRLDEPADGSVGGKSHRVRLPTNGIASNAGKLTDAKAVNSKANKSTSTDDLGRVNDSTNTLNFKSGNQNTGNVKNNYVTLATGNGNGGNDGNGGGGNDTDTDILSVGTNNKSSVRKGYVEDGVLNNGDMKMVDVNAGTRLKGSITKADAGSGIINVGTLNNGPTNYGTADNTTNHGTVTNMNGYDAQTLAKQIEKEFAVILEGFVG